MFFVRGLPCSTYAQFSGFLRPSLPLICISRNLSVQLNAEISNFLNPPPRRVRTKWKPSEMRGFSICLLCKRASFLPRIGSCVLCIYSWNFGHLDWCKYTESVRLLSPSFSSLDLLPGTEHRSIIWYLRTYSIPHVHRLSSACGESCVCYVFRLWSLAGSKTKRTKLLPQADERRCSKAGTNAKVKWLARREKGKSNPLNGWGHINVVQYTHVITWMWLKAKKDWYLLNKSSLHCVPCLTCFQSRLPPSQANTHGACNDSPRTVSAPDTCFIIPFPLTFPPKMSVFGGRIGSLVNYRLDRPLISHLHVWIFCHLMRSHDWEMWKLYLVGYISHPMEWVPDLAERPCSLGYQKSDWVTEYGLSYQSGSE